MISFSFDIAHRVVLLAFVDSEFSVHLLVGFVPQLVIKEGNHVVNHPSLSKFIGLETELHDRLVLHRLWASRTLIEINIMVCNLLYDSTEVVTLSIVVTFSVGSITLNDK